MNKLVNYSSSSSEDENLEPAVKKVKLPIPFAIQKLENIESTVQKIGRKRQIPHIEGNWSCHVYIDCLHLKNILSVFLNNVKEKYSEIEIIETPHISLSKNFIIKYHWIDGLSKVLMQNVEFSKFNLKFDISHIEFLSNEDKSRHFACILADKASHNDLEKLIGCMDKSLKEYDLPIYYENRIYHASIFWKLNEFSVDEKKFLREKIYKFVQNENVLYSIVEKITFKTGNKIKFLNCQ